MQRNYPNHDPLQTMPHRKVAPRASGAQPVPRMNASRTPSTARARAEPRASVGSAAGLGQRYGIATHDALFKYVLMDDAIRPSFFNAFVPGLRIKASSRLDEHMNPIQELQHLREFFHQKSTSEIVGELASADCFVSCCDLGRKRRRSSNHEKATNFLSYVVAHFEEMKKAFPKAQYDGTMHFVCKLDNGEYALVEMQVFPKDGWDKRALAYVSAFYGNQLRKGSHWNDIKKVVGINILGGGVRDQVHWKNTPDQFMRHYRFQEQLHKKSCERFIDGIELFQYSVMNAPDILQSSDQEKQDWIAFFKRGSRMSQAEVKLQIHTAAVLKAFERATLSKLPDDVKEDYEAEHLRYTQVSQFTAERVAEGRAEGKAEGKAEGQAAAFLQAARVMKQETKLSNAEIAKKFGLHVSQVASIRVVSK